MTEERQPIGTEAEPVPGLKPPQEVRAVADAGELELVWHNELGGLTYRAGDLYVKWNPLRTGVDLGEERLRLDWLAGRHPVPPVVDFGENDSSQWLITTAIEGDMAVGDRWRARSDEAIRAIAEGLRAFHALPVDGVPTTWTPSWVTRHTTWSGPRPAVDDPVLVHGDACAPNTLISDAGRWVGHVDLGDVAVGDRWADLAIASLSLDWNFGPGHQQAFFDAYGVDVDGPRLAYYRHLWHQES
ncbi:MAG: aminoglycoside 3'-phosphotransferase [Actinomycetota bacterium]